MNVIGYPLLPAIPVSTTFAEAPIIVPLPPKHAPIDTAHHRGHTSIPSEAIEEAVHREVLEEVGIKIKNLKYLKSQSWPFPNSLMLAFTAEYESGDIKVDGDEILKAKWFKKDEIIRYSSDISISDWLIQDFIDSTD